MRTSSLLLVLLPLSGPLAAQTAPAAFVSTLGKDTIAFEQYSRAGNIITGVWVSLQGGVGVHRYVITLGADGMPARYEMTLSLLGVTARPGELRSVRVEYGPDSATVVTQRDSTTTQRVAMKGAVPLLGRSVAGLELALARLRSAHADSASIIVNLPTGPAYTPTTIPVKFFGPDSVRIAGSALARFDRDGRVLSVTAGPAETRRVPALDVPRLVDGFVAAAAPRAAAESVAMAARREIALPAAALQRFVGEYAATPSATLTVTLDGDTLFIQAAGQRRLQLFAESPISFFLKVVNAQVQFETDSAGTVTGLVVVQNGVPQRARKVNHP